VASVGMAGWRAEAARDARVRPCNREGGQRGCLDLNLGGAEGTQGSVTSFVDLIWVCCCDGLRLPRLCHARCTHVTQPVTFPRRRGPETLRC
jgi:hypothetical protein